MAYKINTLNNADIRVIINNKNAVMTLHKNAEILDHPDGSVTTEKIADGAITPDKLSAVAGVDSLGGIKLHSCVSGGKKVNISGLVVDESTGVTYVATKANGGISQDDAGALCIAAATDAEVEAGTDIYKPITPVTMKKIRESLSAEIDSLNNKFGYSETPQRIGTWVNGVPVWRVAFEDRVIPYSETDPTWYLDACYSPFNDYETFNHKYVKDSRNARIIAGTFVIDAGSSSISGKQRSYLEFDFGETELTMTNTFIKREPLYFSGWVDFITPESNIKTT